MQQFYNDQRAQIKNKIDQIQALQSLLPTKDQELKALQKHVNSFRNFAAQNPSGINGNLLESMFLQFLPSMSPQTRKFLKYQVFYRESQKEASLDVENVF